MQEDRRETGAPGTRAEEGKGIEEELGTARGGRRRGRTAREDTPKISRAGIFKKSMGARHRGGIGFSYRPARLHRLAEFIPWNQCQGPINI